MKPLTEPVAGADDRRLALKLLETLQGWSYQEVRLPAWLELDRIAPALTQLGAETCKFIAPDQRVLVLLPDPTLGVISQGPLPGAGGVRRVCYWADAYRATRQWGWSRIPQVGAELLGPLVPEADAEVVAVAIDAVQVAGRHQLRIFLNDLELTAALCDLLDADRSQAARAALAQGDFVSLERLTGEWPELGRALRFAGPVVDFAEVLTPLRAVAGARDAWLRIEARYERLKRVDALLEATDIEAERLIDVSLVREVGYYDGFVFQVLARGSGALLAGGGRYDGLLRAFGGEGGAVGFACNLAALAGHDPQRPAPIPDYVVQAASPADLPAAWRKAWGLRRQGRSVRLQLGCSDELPRDGFRQAGLLVRGGVWEHRPAAAAVPPASEGAIDHD